MECLLQATLQRRSINLGEQILKITGAETSIKASMPKKENPTFATAIFQSRWKHKIVDYVYPRVFLIHFYVRVLKHLQKNSHKTGNYFEVLCSVQCIQRRKINTKRCRKFCYKHFITTRAVYTGEKLTISFFDTNDKVYYMKVVLVMGVLLYYLQYMDSHWWY